ncbi:MAG: hypothetical protein HYU41_21910 [Candidatus Rokubacteria bacterium]|nr:hypothetical protein [Candidatus Rokubacteria bacterium]
MKTICAWCEHEGRRVTVAAGDQPDDLTISYGICDQHTARLVSQLHRYFPPRKPAPNVPDTLTA